MITNETPMLSYQYQELVKYPVYVETLNEYQIVKLYFEYILPLKQQEEMRHYEFIANNPQMKGHPGNSVYQDVLTAEKTIIAYLRDKKHKGQFRRSAEQMSQAGKGGKRKPDERQIDLVKAFLQTHSVTKRTPGGIHNRIKNDHPQVTLAWLKKHIKKF